MMIELHRKDTERAPLRTEDDRVCINTNHIVSVFLADSGETMIDTTTGYVISVKEKYENVRTLIGG